MIKHTLVISQKAFVFHKDRQLHIKLEEKESTVPIEDVGILMLESHQCVITQSALSALMANNTVVIGCDSFHQPNGITIPLAGNVLHTAVLKDQLTSSIPLRKQLWEQTVKAKMRNQAVVLMMLVVNANPLERLSRHLRSGDPENYEGRAAAYYWKNFFPADYCFLRSREGDAPNNLLNYGYAILRAAMARAVVSSGLHPAIGLHHKNQYNPFCLVDDLMEPYRPCLDIVVRRICMEEGREVELSGENKKRLLGLLSTDVQMENERKPLELALTSTTSSLVHCYAKETRSLAYPSFCAPKRI